MGTTRRNLLKAADRKRKTKSLPRQWSDPAPPPDWAAHDANRMMFGPAWGDYERIRDMGHEAFVQEQLHPDGIDDAWCASLVDNLDAPSLTESDQALYDRRNEGNGVNSDPVYHTRYATWIRMLYSKRQLFERMTDFWHNHFNVYCWDYTVKSMWPSWDRLIRTHAFGNFRAFLEAAANHPCMLYYLDNYINTAAGPNENYAREMFELHTLGQMNYNVPDGYIDNDVFTASRCFTGWTYERDSEDPNRGLFKYVDGDHDRFEKTLFRDTPYEVYMPHNQGPMRDGKDCITALANHPGTARHIAWKLCVRFVSDTPSDALVQSIADMFHANRSDAQQIRKTVEAILLSDEYQNSRMTKFKRPLDWMVSTARAFNMNYPANKNWDWYFDDLGQDLFAWGPPDGPPDTFEAWANSYGLLQRWNFAFRTASGWNERNGVEFQAERMIPANSKTPRALADYWCWIMLKRQPSTELLDAVRRFIADGRGFDSELSQEHIEDKSRYVGALICMSREFMRR